MNTNYFKWLVADTLTALGGGIRAFIMPVLVVIVEGSNAKAGTLSAVSSFILAITTMIGGVIVDRYDRRKLLILYCLISLVIFTGAVIWLNIGSLTWIFLLTISILTSLRAGLLGSASNVLLRNIVATEKLPKAMSINQGRDAALELASKPVGGFLIGINYIIPFICEVFFMLFASLAAFLLPPPPNKNIGKTAEADCEPKKQNDSTPNTTTNALLAPIVNFFKDIKAGFSLVVKNKLMQRIVLISAAYFPFLNGLIFLLVLGMIDAGNSPVSAATLESSIAAGALAGSFAAGYLTEKLKTGTILIISCLLPTPFALFAVFANNFWLRCVSLLMLIIALPAANAAFGGFMMKVIPHDLLGRKFCHYEFIFYAPNPVSELVRWSRFRSLDICSNWMHVNCADDNYRISQSFRLPAHHTPPRPVGRIHKHLRFSTLRRASTAFLAGFTSAPTHPKLEFASIYKIAS